MEIKNIKSSRVDKWARSMLIDEFKLHDKILSSHIVLEQRIEPALKALYWESSYFYINYLLPFYKNPNERDLST